MKYYFKITEYKRETLHPWHISFQSQGVRKIYFRSYLYTTFATIYDDLNFTIYKQFLTVQETGKVFLGY
jgi:hypothetical protein